MSSPLNDAEHQIVIAIQKELFDQSGDDLFMWPGLDNKVLANGEINLAALARAVLATITENHGTHPEPRP